MVKMLGIQYVTKGRVCVNCDCMLPQKPFILEKMTRINGFRYRIPYSSSHINALLTEKK